DGSVAQGSVQQGAWRYYKIDITDQNSNLRVFLDDPDNNGAQDADLYVRYGALPTTSNFDYRPYINGDEDVCVTKIMGEDFEGSWGTYGNNPPTGWTIMDYGDESPKTWNTNDWYKYYNDSTYKNVARIFYYPVEHSNDWLLSPLFNIPSSAELDAVTLEFDHWFKYYNNNDEFGYVAFKSDQHPTWTTLATYSTDMSSMTHVSIDLSAYRGDTNCQIMFQYYAYDGWYWMVDNVEVRGRKSSAPNKERLRAGSWYIGVRGYANTNNGYTLYTYIDKGCTQSLIDPDPGKRENGGENFIPPDPKAPIGSTTWGTVNGTGVWKGTGTPSFTESGHEPEAVVWVQRNGQSPYNLPNLNTKTIIQLPDTTLIVGCDASLTSAKGIFYSPAGDEGQTQWIEASAVAGTSSKVYVDVIQSPNGDVLIAANGSGSTPGGVWLSGDKGRNWMRISQGFDSSSQALEDIVADSGTPVSYYASTDSTGLWTRTITASPYPTRTSISPNNGSDQGGTAVTITGTGFSNSCPTGVSSDCPSTSPKVIFGDVEVNGTWVSSTQITATTPAHSIGSVSVKVRNPDTRQTSSG
ncbi:MAG: IPT/TIG domain-containing protein, partial [Acidobacteria bacterium]|nr:IPT/TIG domain-containing protein [Acidobacteriota bacterium]